MLSRGLHGLVLIVMKQTPYLLRGIISIHMF